MIPPLMTYKDWAIVEDPLGSKFYHHLPDYPGHDGFTEYWCSSTIRCRMCNISMPEEVYNFLVLAFKFYKVT